MRLVKRTAGVKCTVGVLSVAAASLVHAQEPRPPGTDTAVEATVGNDVLQMRYLSPSPLRQFGGDLDYGVLLSQSREFIGSAALMFRTDLDVLPHLHFEIGPQAYLALLAAGTKTDVFALAPGVTARYEIAPRIGLAVIGSAFYSPDVLTFGSAHNLYDFMAGGEVRFLSRLTGIAGYRWLKFTLVNEPDEKVQNEVFAGLRWQLQ